MAQDIVSGLFGLSPWQVEQQRNQQVLDFAKTSAELAPKGFGQAALFMGQGAGNLARPIAGMMGMVDPAVQEAQQRQAALQGLDISSPEAILQRAQQIQDPQLRMRLMLMAQQQKAQQQEAAYKQAQAKRLESQATLDLAQAQKALRENPNLITTEVGVEGKPGWTQTVLVDKTNPAFEPVKVGPPKQSSAAMKIEMGDRSSPFYQAIPTAEGYQSFNARTGTMSPLMVGGKSVLPAAQDPTLQGRITGAKTEAKERGEAEVKREVTMSGIGSLISEANSILSGDGDKKPTASGIGTAADVAGGFFGVAPSGANEAAKLRVISGALVSKMPRMEGPQSDKDTQMYKEMAGLVGDSTKPISTRQAALKTVQDLYQKYDKTSAIAGLPSGSVKIGKTPDGRDVYQSPDGRKWVQ